MANHKLANPLNVPGPLFVDTTCIDCGTCYHIASALFREENESSRVSKQPDSLEEWTQAKTAILSCPTTSIGTTPTSAFAQAPNVLPQKIEQNIYYCGYTAKSSFGATTYFIQRPEGNILIDSPRFHPQLVKKFEDMGGVKWMFLSHRDDVADHDKFHEHFGCQRIIHKRDAIGPTMNCEIQLEEELDFKLDSEVLIIATPGHSEGHLCLLYRNEFLFTGDHLFVSQEDHALYASKNVSWYSWTEQKKSLAKLLNYQFSWILPGHGGWGKFDEYTIKSGLKKYV